jgi:uncharacterized RDD family membrane protein YckC
MDKDIYSPPDSSLVTEETSQQPLATRNARLVASLVDMIVMGAITFPLMYLTGGFSQIMQGKQPGIGYNLMMFVAGTVVFLAFNYRLLTKHGQTVGKKVLGIKIVDGHGGLPSGTVLLKRYFFYFIPPQLPFVGPLISTVNLLFIFGSQRRCLHDMFANTNVVKIIGGQ